MFTEEQLEFLKSLSILGHTKSDALRLTNTSFDQFVEWKKDKNFAKEIQRIETEKQIFLSSENHIYATIQLHQQLRQGYLEKVKFEQKAIKERDADGVETHRIIMLQTKERVPLPPQIIQLGLREDNVIRVIEDMAASGLVDSNTASTLINIASEMTVQANKALRPESSQESAAVAEQKLFALIHKAIKPYEGEELKN